MAILQCAPLQQHSYRELKTFCGLNRTLGEPLHRNVCLSTSFAHLQVSGVPERVFGVSQGLVFKRDSLFNDVAVHHGRGFASQSVDSQDGFTECKAHDRGSLFKRSGVRKGTTLDGAVISDEVQEEGELPYVVTEDKTSGPSYLGDVGISELISNCILVEDGKVVRRLEFRPVEDEDIVPITEMLKMKYPRKANSLANENIKFLMSIGAKPKQIMGMFCRSGSMHGAYIHVNVIERVQVFFLYGFDQDEAVRAICKDSTIIVHPLDKIEEILCYLKDLNVTRIGKVVSQQTTLLRHSMANLKEKVDFLESVGVESVGHAVDRCPRLLSYHKSKLVEGVRNLREILGRDDIGKLIQSCPHNLGMNVQTVMDTHQGLVSKFGVQATLALIEKDPGVLQRAWKTIVAKLDYIENTMGRDLIEVQRWPRVVTYSLSDVLEPRYEALLSKGIVDAPLSSICCQRDEAFEERFLVSLSRRRSRRVPKSELQAWPGANE